MTTINCFVIMPFAPEFDDVYSLIKSSVEVATSIRSGKCFRLDESQPAGRITDRLLNELDSADLCVADLTGCSPNVMWEVGYAMALRKPIIIISQGVEGLPFDLKDMHAIRYDRTRMSATLGEQLKKSVIDTLQMQERHARASEHSVSVYKGDAPLIGELLNQVADLKAIVGESVNNWSKKSYTSGTTDNTNIPELQIFEGYWIDTISGSHLCARVIENDLIVPYCFGGDNYLTSVFYSWERMNGYWFTRYVWLDSNTHGFAFLRNISVDNLNGHWWLDSVVKTTPRFPEQKGGNPINLIRQSKSIFPVWAEKFLKKVALEGLPAKVLKQI